MPVRPTLLPLLVLAVVAFTLPVLSVAFTLLIVRPVLESSTFPVLSTILVLELDVPLLPLVTPVLFDADAVEVLDVLL